MACTTRGLLKELLAQPCIFLLRSPRRSSTPAAHLDAADLLGIPAGNACCVHGGEGGMQRDDKETRERRVLDVELYLW